MQKKNIPNKKSANNFNNINEINYLPPDNKSSKSDAEESDNSDFFEVEKIISKNIKNGKTQYLIKWEGYPQDQNTWEPVENLSNISEMINEFEMQEEEKMLMNKKSKLNKNTKINNKDLIEYYKDYGVDTIVGYDKKKKTKHETIQSASATVSTSSLGGLNCNKIKILKNGNGNGKIILIIYNIYSSFPSK
jgi:hypothetical protein